MRRENNDSQSSSKPRDIKFIPIDNLLLDSKNPRLASGPGASSQFDLLRILWTEMAIDELVLSIAKNGFFPEEPLFVIPDTSGKENKKYIVVEGNRRLAAVLILVYDDNRDRLRATDMPRISDEEKKSLKSLPVSIYDNRKQLWTYLGFRHINSPKPWDAFSKARYVAQVHDEYNIPLEEIAVRIGDRHATVVRLYNGYKILRQAERTGIFKVQDQFRNRFYFSHLYTALEYTEFQEFLNVTPDDFLQDDPVPDSNLPQLEELMIWLYGRKSENKEPVVKKQNPDLNRLRDIISKPIAMNALRSGYSLERSFEISIGDERRFQESLTKAKEELQQAKATVTTGYSGDEELYNVIQDIQTIAKTIQMEMRPRFNKANNRRIR